MTSNSDTNKVLGIDRRMIDKTVRVLEGSYTWIGKVIDVVDTENVLVKRNRDAEPKTINMFDIRSL